MGCCKSKGEVIIPITKEEKQNSTDIKGTLAFYTSIFMEDFEKILLEKITPEKPKSMHEFSKAINFGIKVVCENFNSYTSHFAKDSATQSELQKYKLFIVSKCKSKEGYFNFLNSFYSFDFIYQLEKHLVEGVMNEKLSIGQCIIEFNRLAKGCFMLEGLDDLHTVLSLPDSEKFEFIEQKATEIKKELQNFKEQLLLAENALIVLNLRETLTSTPISFSNIERTSSNERAESPMLQDDDVIEYINNCDNSRSKGPSTNYTLQVPKKNNYIQ